MAPNLRRGPPRVHHGASGVQLGPKKCVKPQKNYHAQKFEFSITPQSSVFRKKNGIDGYGAKSPWGPPRVHLWVQWGPIGLKKWVKTVKNYHVPKFEFSITPRSSIFPKKWKFRLWREITVGTPLSPSWGQWGPIGSKKWVEIVKNYHAPKSEISIYPRSSVFRQKWKLRLWRQITVGTP